MAAAAAAAAAAASAVDAAQITVPELVENLGNFYARFARHKLEAGEVSLIEIAESFLTPDKHGVPRLGELCKQLRTLYGAVPFLTKAQLRIAQAPASAVAAGKEGSYGLVSAKIRRFEANRRQSVRLSGGWARDIEVEMAGSTRPAFQGGWLFKRNPGSFSWKQFFCTLQNQYLNCVSRKNPSVRGGDARGAVIDLARLRAVAATSPDISFNMSKVSRIVQKGDMLKLTFEDCVDSPVSRIFFRASTEGEAIAWARALRLRYQAVLLHDLTVRQISEHRHPGEVDTVGHGSSQIRPPPSSFKPAPPGPPLNWKQFSPRTASRQLKEWDRVQGFARGSTTSESSSDSTSRSTSHRIGSAASANSRLERSASGTRLSERPPSTPPAPRLRATKPRDAAAVEELVKRFSHSGPPPPPPRVPRRLSAACGALQAVRQAEQSLVTPDGVSDDWSSAPSSDEEPDIEILAAAAQDGYRFVSARLSDRVQSASELSAKRRSQERL